MFCYMFSRFYSRSYSRPRNQIALFSRVIDSPPRITLFKSYCSLSVIFVVPNAERPGAMLLRFLVSFGILFFTVCYFMRAL